MTVADYPDWSVPQSNASAIASTGVPLLALPGQIISTTQAIAASGGYASGYFAVDQPSYELEINLYESGSGAAGPVQIFVQWTDATQSQSVTTEEYWVWPGTTQPGHIIVGHGPTKGNYVQVSVNNTSAAMAYTAKINFYLRSHIYTRDDVRTLAYPTTASGNALATIDMPSSLIGWAAQSVNAGATYTAELPLYGGPCYLWFQSQSGTSDMVFTIVDSANPNSAGLGAKIMQFDTNANGIGGGNIVLPRYQCRATMKNGNAAAQSLVFTLHTYEQAC